MLKEHGQLMAALLKAADLLAVLTAWALGYALRYNAWTSDPAGHPPFQRFLTPAALSLLLTFVLYSRAGLYRPKRAKSLLQEMLQTGRTVVVAWGLTYMLANFTSIRPVPRLLMLCVLASWLVVAVTERLVGRTILRSLRRRGWNCRSAAIVGTGRLAQRTHQALQRESWTGIIVNYFVGNGDAQSQLEGLPVYSGLDKINEILAEHPVDAVFVSLSNNDNGHIRQVLDKLSSANVAVSIVPDLLPFNLLQRDVTLLAGMPIISMTHSPQHGWNSLVKRAFDMVVSGLAIVVLALPMMLISLAIKLTSRGPVLFRQERASLAGRTFGILKFRTMMVDAEKETGPVMATRGDPRVTRLGRFMRKTSLDELPQFFNVFMGQMSLVGPRPERPELIQNFRHDVPRYMLRHRVKAGLTGWAQVNGLRGQTSIRKRIQYDLYYVTNWSFGLDLRILAMTPLTFLGHANAY